MSKENPHKWFTAGEAATLARTHGIAGVPTTKSGMIRWVKRFAASDYYDELSVLSRRRQGQKGGGGTEYYWCFFDEAIWDVLDAEVARRTALVPWEPKRPAQRPKATDMPKKPIIDLSPPAPMFAADLAAIAGLDSVPCFTSFVIRIASRGRVIFGSRRSFSCPELAPFHAKEVCLTSAPECPDRVFVFEYSKPRRQMDWRYGPGPFIGIATLSDGRSRYVPVEAQRQAETKRQEAANRRRILTVSQDTPKE